MSLYERMKRVCNEKGTNFKRLEQELGFGNGTLRKWENQNPSYDKVVAVANKLNVSLNWLILGKESEDLTPEEQQLIDLYRQADERGKRSILVTAQNEAKELTTMSSASGTGSTGTDS